MEKKESGRYKLKIIGEKEPLFYSDLKTALDCLTRAQQAGKIAFLLRYDEKTRDYTMAL